VTGPFAAHPGGHAAPARLSIFRRLLRTTRRKPAVPAALGPAGAAVARFACCPHCQGMCAHPDNHPVPCSDGCNVPAWRPAPRRATEPAGFPVLGDSMLADVRHDWDHRQHGGLNLAQQLAHADAMHAASAPYLPPHRPVNGRTVGTGTQPRRQPVYGERPQADVLAAERLAFERDAAQAAGIRARFCYSAPPRELLEQLLDGLKKL
jgi:hypothetical protein